eukprot:143678-Rhodomonas_salina.1
MSWIIKHSWTPLMREGRSINDSVPMLFPFPTKIFNAAPEYGQPVKPEPDDYRYFGCEALFVDWRASHELGFKLRSKGAWAERIEPRLSPEAGRVRVEDVLVGFSRDI